VPPAGRTRAAVDALPPAVSVFADRDDFLYRDYAKVIRELRAATARVAELEAMKRPAAPPAGLRGWLERLGILKRSDL